MRLQAAIAFKGGETAALQRLKHYLWDSGCISEYFNTRNGMLGPDYSTKFSPWLAHGCISPRTIHHEVCTLPGLSTVLNAFRGVHGSCSAPFLDACLERAYTLAGPPVGDQASDQP